MAKKAFESVPFDPIQTDLLREALKHAPRHAAVAATSGVPVGVSIPPAPPPPTPVVIPPPPPDPVLHPEGLGQPVPPPQSMAVTGIAKRFVLTREEDAALKAFLARLEERARTTLTLSTFVRSAVQLLMQFEQAIGEEMAQTAPGRLPSNHDAVAMSMYEEWCLRCLIEALRKARGQGQPTK